MASSITKASATGVTTRMNRMKLWASCLFLLLGAATTQFDAALAQPNRDDAWTEEAHRRLKAIYEDGHYRAKRLEARWTADGSGYIVRELDPQTNRRRPVRYDAETGERLTENAAGDRLPDNANRRRSPDGKHILEVRGGNVVVRNLDSNDRTQLIKRPEDRDIRYHGFAWSPNGKRVVLIESDQTDVRMRSMLVPSDPTYPGVRDRRFARVGETIPSLRVGVIDVDRAKVNWLPIHDADEAQQQGYYLGQLGWAGNSNEVLIEKLSRFRDRREFLIADIDAGTIESIFTETNKAWAISSQGKNLGLIWINDGRQFIVITEKDGWRHAYLYSRDGKELSLLTPGQYDIIDRGPVDEEENWFYFYASPENGTQRFLYRVPLDGSGKLDRVTPDDQPGTHDYDFSPNHKWAFHTYSTLDTPPVVSLIKLPDHRLVRVLEDNSELQETIASQGTPPTEFFALDIGDGVSMDAWMMKPKGFDESKKYPVFVYVYGEPHGQTVLDQWGAVHSHFHRLVADLGYLVVSIDNRGTPAPKGAAWRRSIFGSLGPLSTEDQAAGLRELNRKRPYVDLSRVAIWGWSGGGSNTLNALFRKPDVYHVGIAVVPKPQPHLYNAWFQEIYMRSREVNADGYRRAAPIHFADGLQGKLLMITGSGETNTHIQIIEGLVDRLVELGKAFDYMVYPNRDHGLGEGRGTRVHVRMLIIRYLIENLPRGPR